MLARHSLFGFRNRWHPAVFWLWPKTSRKPSSWDQSSCRSWLQTGRGKVGLVHIGGTPMDLFPSGFPVRKDSKKGTFNRHAHVTLPASLVLVLAVWDPTNVLLFWCCFEPRNELRSGTSHLGLGLLERSGSVRVTFQHTHPLPLVGDSMDFKGFWDDRKVHLRFIHKPGRPHVVTQGTLSVHQRAGREQSDRPLGNMDCNNARSCAVLAAVVSLIVGLLFPPQQPGVPVYISSVGGFQHHLLAELREVSSAGPTQDPPTENP